MIVDQGKKRVNVLSCRRKDGVLGRILEDAWQILARDASHDAPLRHLANLGTGRISRCAPTTLGEPWHGTHLTMCPDSQAWRKQRYSTTYAAPPRHCQRQWPISHSISDSHSAEALAPYLSPYGGDPLVKCCTQVACAHFITSSGNNAWYFTPTQGHGMPGVSGQEIPHSGLVVGCNGTQEQIL